jgi:hypothetical protein
MSRRSRERVLVMFDVVYFGVGMNLKPRPRTRQVWWGIFFDWLGCGRQDWVGVVGCFGSLWK